MSEAKEKEDFRVPFSLPTIIPYGVKMYLWLFQSCVCVSCSLLKLKTIFLCTEAQLGPRYTQWCLSVTIRNVTQQKRFYITLSQIEPWWKLPVISSLDNTQL